MVEVGEKAPGKATLGELLRLSAPVLLATFSQTLMIVVDTYFAGYIGEEAQAALAFVGPVIWSIPTLFNGIIAAINTFVAQAWGAKKIRDIGLYLSQAVGIALLASVPTALLALVLPGVFTKFISDVEVRTGAIRYGVIRLLFFIFPYFNVAAAGLFEGLGRMVVPMAVAISAHVVNAFLDWVLVTGAFGLPRCGVEGLAWASVAGSILGTVVYVFLLGRRSFFRSFLAPGLAFPGGQPMKDFLRIGIPQGFGWFMEAASWSLFLLLVATLGREVAASQQIAVSILHFAFMPGIAAGTATTTLVGQYIGAGRSDLARKTFRNALGLIVSYMGAVGIIFITCRHPIMRVFSNNSEVIRIGAIVLIYAGIWQVFDGTYIACACALRGAGDTFFTMCVYVGLSWFFFLPLAYVLGFAFRLGVHGAWAAATSYIALAGLIVLWRWQSGAWEKLKVVSRDEACSP